MTDLWRLPETVTLGGREYPIHGDFRDILEIFSYLGDPAMPEFIRWEIALGLFYRDPIPQDLRREAMEQLAAFITRGRREKPGPRLLDWDHDAAAIVADVNKVAGKEIRALPFVHWWTFLSWFDAIGQGQLSALVEIRDKLARGQKLDEGQRQFYRENRERIDLPKVRSPQDEAQRQRLEQLLSASSADTVPAIRGT